MNKWSIFNKMFSQLVIIALFLIVSSIWSDFIQSKRLHSIMNICLKVISEEWFHGGDCAYFNQTCHFGNYFSILLFLSIISKKFYSFQLTTKTSLLTWKRLHLNHLRNVLFENPNECQTIHIQTICRVCLYSGAHHYQIFIDPILPL